MRAFARLCGGHVRNRPVAKAAQNRAGRHAIAITIVDCLVACWRSAGPPGVPTLVLASLLAAGEVLAAPRTCILRLVASVIFSTRNSTTCFSEIPCRLFSGRVMLATRDVVLGRLKVGKGRAAGTAQVRPLARVRADVCLKGICRCRRIRAVRALVRPVTRVRADVRLQGICRCRCI